MDLKGIVGQAATICTIAVFLAGIEICQKIYRKRATNDISALPFLCGLVSCSFWLRYGLLMNDTALIIVNATGASLQSLYIMVYIRYCTNRSVFCKQSAFAASVIICLYYYTTFHASHEEACYIAGIAACSAGVFFMASPLASMAHVLKTKNVESLPFAMILSTFVMATLWLCYGILANDKFIQIPNFLGALLALGQLCLFILFPNKKPYFELPNGA